MIRWLVLVCLLSLNVFAKMPHTPRNIQAPYVAADFWEQWSSDTPRMALFIKVTPQSFWTGASAIGFTSNTRNMTLPGHPGITFYSAPGVTPTLADQILGETSSVDFQGIYQTGIFERSDVIAGKWNFAEIEVFSACWDNTNLGELVHARGNLGEFKDYQTYFTAEGRGLLGRLSREVDESTQRLCRVREFGDTRCGKVLTGSFTYDATTDHASNVFTETAHGMRTGEFVSLSVVSGSINGGLTANTGYYVIKDTANTFKLATSLANARAGTNITGISDAVGVVQVNRGVIIVGGVVYQLRQTFTTVDPNASQVIYMPVSVNQIYENLFRNGKLTATSGLNAGISREIAYNSGYIDGQSLIHLKREFPYPVDAGTDFTITAGCVRTIEDCRKYGNAARFNGEPFVPNIENVNRITSAH
jgi:hypothetical protein